MSICLGLFYKQFFFIFKCVEPFLTIKETYPPPNRAGHYRIQKNMGLFSILQLFKGGQTNLLLYLLLHFHFYVIIFFSYRKSTFFNVLTKSQASAENFPFCTIGKKYKYNPLQIHTIAYSRVDCACYK